MPRLSSQALYALRNHINIDRLITQVLQMPIQQRDGRVRFQCPLCARFHTATHPNTNLARCFECEKNFNTIELVMAVRNIPFLEAVALLKQTHKILANRAPPCQPPRGLPNPRASPDPNPAGAPAHACDAKAKPTQQQPTNTKATSRLIAIKQILNML